MGHRRAQGHDGGWYLIKNKDSVENVIETTGHASSSLYVKRAVQEFRYNVVFIF